MLSITQKKAGEELVPRAVRKTFFLPSRVLFSFFLSLSLNDDDVNLNNVMKQCCSFCLYWTRLSRGGEKGNMRLFSDRKGKKEDG